MRKHWPIMTLVAIGAALLPQAASARFIALQCKNNAFDIYTDAKYLVLRPNGDDPAKLMEHTVFTDDYFQGDRSGTDGGTVILTIDRKTGLAGFFENGVLRAFDRCAPRGAAAPSSAPDATPNAPSGNKF